MGTWYPQDKAVMDKTAGPLDSYGPYRIAVLPHAGLFFSGSLIRTFFESIPKETEHVIILSPSHYFRMPASRIAVAEYTESETPYGCIRTKKLEIPKSIIDNNAAAAEHGIEMFLPFIGKKGLSVSYGIISSLSTPEDAATIASFIKPFIDNHTVLIASSDFTHYGKRFRYVPYGNNTREKVIQHDMECASILSVGKGIEAYRQYAGSTICGIAAASIAAELAKSMNMTGETGDGFTSADILSDTSDDFVSYRTVFWR